MLEISDTVIVYSCTYFGHVVRTLDVNLLFNSLLFIFWHELSVTVSAKELTVINQCSSHLLFVSNLAPYIIQHGHKAMYLVTSWFALRCVVNLQQSGKWS